MPDPQLILMSAAGGCLAAALAIAFVLIGRRQVSAAEPASLSAEFPDDAVFLFEGRTLVDGTDQARAQIPDEPAESDDWGRFVLAFSHRFEDLEETFSALQEGESATIPEVPDDPASLRLDASSQNGLLRITLADPLQGERSELIEHYSLAAMRAELCTLRSVAELSPWPTWKKRRDGTIIWANGAYMQFAQELAGRDSLMGWPPPDIFGAARISHRESENMDRVIVGGIDDEKEYWFDRAKIVGEIEDLCFAAPVDKLVRAEKALSEFVQTLTKTFAHLRIGLAIFDQKRQLALFNPALVDLTGLPPEQLSTRPTLHSFLDALRERQRIPEPKDYKSWRLQIAQLETGAADGTYEEVWHLPTGQTYRVSGRPHPNGAVAYVFEDISSEVSMTRSFRSEIEMSQSVLDNLDIAVAAFTQDGVLAVSNDAYDALWKTAPGSALTDTGIAEATQHWKSMSRPSQAWDDIKRSVLRSVDRQPWNGLVQLKDGQVLRCQVRSLSGGGTLVSFQQAVNAPNSSFADAAKPDDAQVVA